MGVTKYFAYLMILAGIILEFFTFQLCSRTSCYFFGECGGKLSVECLASFLVASLLLIVGGVFVLKRERDNRYT